MIEDPAPALSEKIPEAIRDILADEVAAARSRFRQLISQTVADFGRSGNRYGTSLVNRMDEAGRTELQDRASRILAVWNANIVALPAQPLEATIAAMQARVGLEAADVESVVQGVDMGRTPTHPLFLKNDAERISRRFAAELNTLLVVHNRGGDRSEIVQLKPGMWGLSLDLKALWRRIAG